MDVEKIRVRYTAPYYLSMASLDDDGIRDFVGLARAAHLDEVLWMLETEEWRSRKVGAWFALVRDEPEVADALEKSLLTSRGSLTAPELGVVLVQLRGAASLPLLLAYQEIGIRDGHGPQGEITNLIRTLGGVPLVDGASELETVQVSAKQQAAERIVAAAG